MDHRQRTVVDYSLDNLYRKIQVHIESNLVAVIGCGSAVHDILSNSDVDVIIVVKEFNASTVHSLSTAHSEIETAFKIIFSTTVIELEDVEKLNSRYLLLDGKAVQCLVEADEKKISTTKNSFTIPTLSNKQLKKFSYANYWVIRSLLVKLLTRAAYPLSLESQNKLAKVGLIAVKMADQYHDSNNANLKSRLSRVKESTAVLPQDEIIKIITECTELLSK